MRMKTCPICREPFKAAHPMAVCQWCAEHEVDALDAQMERELEHRVAFLMTDAERHADQAAWHLSFNVAA